MSETIIANNCIAGSMLHDLGLRFNTPTINLQILPREYIKFCRDFRHYMETEIQECKQSELSDVHKYDLINMFGHVPINEFPYGLCDDILIVFQHYSNFNEARAAWNRRKARVDYDHIGFMFYIAWEHDQHRAAQFLDLGLKNSVVFTERFDINLPHFRVDSPEGGHFLDVAPNGKKYFAQVFSPEKFIKEVRER